MKRIDDKILNEAAQSYQVVKHRTEGAQRAIDQAKAGADRLGRESDQLSNELDDLLSQVDALLDGDFDFSDEDVANADDMLKQIEDNYTPRPRYEYEKLETLDAYGSWENLMSEVSDYAERNGIDLSADPFDGLLTQTERDRIGEKILADYKIDMDPEERKSAIETYLSYAMLFAAIGTGRASEHKDEINSLCEMASDLLGQYVNIDPKYSHKDFLEKPGTLNEWFIYFNKYYPDLVTGSFVPSNVSEKSFEPTGSMEDALHDMGKRPTWVGMAFSMIYQFAQAEESTGIDKNLYVANVSGSPELVGRNTACRLIAGFVNWLDALCGSAEEYTKAANDTSDIRNMVMAVLDKCGFGESDQEGLVKSVQDFALDVYNNLCGEYEQINAKNVEIFACDFVMQFLVSLQKRAEGVPFAKAAASAGDDFVRRCQVAGYGILSILKKGSAAVGKADVVSPLFRLVNSVDVDGWAEFTYQSLVRARTVYLGYYIDLEKMDEDLKEGWQELLDNGIKVSRRQIK